MKNKKTMIAIVSVIAVVLVLIGVTYAYWLVTKEQQGENVISSACLDIEMTENPQYEDITLQDQYPMSDEEGMKLVPFEFMVTNNCNATIDYQINLETLGSESNTIIPSAIKVALNNDVSLLSEKGEASPTLSDAYTARKLITGTLGYAGEASSETPISKVYDLRLWIDENAPVSEANKTFRSKITVTVGQGIVNADNLATLIRADAEENNYLYTTTPTFSTPTSKGEYGLYSALDDYGTSYYFRGDVENNIVAFGTYAEAPGKKVDVFDSEGNSMGMSYSSMEECIADEGNGYPPGGDYTCKQAGYDVGDPIYWRIIRINGDDSVRMIYAGPVAEENNHIGSSAYNENSYNGTDFLNYAITKDVSSTIKTVVDSWYSKHLATNYSKFIADKIFCNDVNVNNTYTSTNELDQSMKVTEYEGYYRLETNKNPILTCTRAEDKYTVSSANGNGLLTYPIGLITADEVAMAGTVFSNLIGDTSNNYLIENAGVNISSYGSWTMTSGYEKPNASVFAFGSSNLDINTRVDSEYLLVKPVINIGSDVFFEGSGTATDPYKIIS